MKKTLLQCFFIVCAVVFVLTSLAYSAPVGKITRLEGKVDVLKAGQRTVVNVSLGDNVDVGDIYRAKTNSRAEITFLNKNILRIHPATRVQISQYSDDGTQCNHIMKMDRGRVEAVSGKEFIKKVSSFAEGNKFEVHTPNAVAGIRGSGMTIGFAQTVTGLFFSTGRGYFYNPNQPGQVVNISAGFVSFIVGTGGIPSHPVPGNVSYVGGTGLEFDGGTTEGELLRLNIQTAGFRSPVDWAYTFAPPPQVPNVFVGSVGTLTGTYSAGNEIINISLNGFKFFGPGMTGIPQSWQADNVTGTYQNTAGSVSTFSGMALSGGGLTANFVTTSPIDTGTPSGNWTADITSVNSPFTFSGTASGAWGGTISGSTASGLINGNASGVFQEPISNPAVLVGMVPYLQGGIGNPETGAALSLNNVRFYGRSATGQPQYWQAESVTGNYWNFHNGGPGFSFIASGGGISAYVQVSSIDTALNNGTWSASISNGTAAAGVGSSTQPLTFSGTASGTFGGVVTGTGGMSGTASGIVPSTLTQDPIVTQTVLVGTIPYIEGSFGSIDRITVRMDNVKFWGPSIATQPHTWTSVSVTGSYTGNPANFVGQPFNMTSLNPLSNSQMTINSFGGGSWTGTISNGNAPSGVGSTFTSPVGFSGNGTGTYSGSTLSGTASGKAYPGFVRPPS